MVHNIIGEPFVDFDEDAYLQANPDVAAAVVNGRFPSGWAHYLAYGFFEARPGVADGVHEQLAAHFERVAPAAVPPEHLRVRAHGGSAIDKFENNGYLVSDALLHALDGRSEPSSIEHVLDFGCGCARVLRYVQQALPTARFTGCDIDAEAIEWCAAHLADVSSFAATGAHPPLPFADETFDLVYSVSVFTHLPEDMQLAWLRELRRVTTNGGYLLLTIHGPDLADVSAAGRAEFLESGFLYGVGPGTDGLPDFYQTAFHTRDYVRDRWGDIFDIEEIRPRAIGFHQDLVVCRT